MAKTEVMENQLAIMIKEAGLEPTKARYIKERFDDYFDLADEWTIKARAIKVTSADQTGDMAMAREGRLFLMRKRTAIEEARKELKEQCLREGKAIDGIANVLKALIVPIEEHLDKQEHFVELLAEQKREAIRLEVEKRIEEERIAKEKADAEALAKAQIENEKLRAEAIELEKKISKERAESEKKRAIAEFELKKEREKVAAKALKEKKEKEKLEAELKAQEEEAMEKALAEKKKAQAKLDAERKEKERLEEVLKNQIICPACGHKFQLKDKK